jgi:hypothetical protein
MNLAVRMTVSIQASQIGTSLSILWTGSKLPPNRPGACPVPAALGLSIDGGRQCITANSPQIVNLPQGRSNKYFVSQRTDHDWVRVYTYGIEIRHAEFDRTLQKEPHIMNDTSKTALIIALVVAVLLLLLFGGGMATGTMMSGGMMGSGSMGGVSWMWLPTLLVVVLGLVLFSAISGKK